MLVLAGDHIAGVDEAGRGPLAGPVVASAVILNFEDWDVDLGGLKSLPGLNDSKKLTAKKREMLYEKIMLNALSVGIGSASAEEIDELNILQASFLAMKRAIENLTITPKEIWVDGNQLPKVQKWEYPSRAIIGGDGKVLEIAAASIIAKVTRDRWMQKLDQSYPGYGFAENSGYPTVLHRKAILKLGITPQHRKSFGPVRDHLDRLDQLKPA
jgi:ribonuclease HII